MQDLKALVKRIDQLPTLPAIATRIMAIIEDPESSAKDLERIISNDVSLASRILRLVNSAYFGVSRRVTDLGQAVAMAGFALVKSVAMGISIFDTLGFGTESRKYRREAFWKHCVATGAVARFLARERRDADAEGAFTVGLLHDIGKLVLDKHANFEFQRILATTELEAVSFRDAEKKVLGDVGHAEVGGWLLEQWRFPQEISVPVANHHAWARGGAHKRLALVCECADWLVVERGIGYGGAGTPPALPDGTWEELKVRREEAQTFLDSVEKDTTLMELFGGS